MSLSSITLLESHKFVLMDESNETNTGFNLQDLNLGLKIYFKLVNKPALRKNPNFQQHVALSGNNLFNKKVKECCWIPP